MRVQPARPSSPFTATVTVSRGARSAMWSAAQRPAPPAPSTRISVSRLSRTRSVAIGGVAPRLLRRRGHQGVEEGAACLAVPVAGARGPGHQAPVAADHDRGRGGAHPVLARDRAVAVEEHGGGHARALHVAGHQVPRLLDAHREHRERLPLPLTDDLLDGDGQLLSTVAAPRGPEVDEHHLALLLRQRCLSAAVQPRQRESGRPFARQGVELELPQVPVDVVGRRGRGPGETSRQQEHAHEGRATPWRPHVTLTSAVPSNFTPCESTNITLSGPASVARNGIVNVGFSLTAVDGSITAISRPRYVTTMRLTKR